MKKIILFTALFLSIHTLNAQTISDTLAYLKTIEANKSQYIGKPFSYLLNKMAIVPKNTFSRPPFNNKYSIIESQFTFRENCNVFAPTVAKLFIKWQSIFPSSEIEAMGQLSNWGFATQERTYYGSKIIADIVVVGKYPPPPSIPGHWIVTSCTYKKVLIDGLYQWRYEIIKKYCENGNTGTAQDITHSTTSQAVENCVLGADAE